MRNIIKISISIIIVAFFMMPLLTTAQENDGKSVHVITIDGEITPAMAAFMRDKIKEASESGAESIIIEIKTLGGRVDSAIEMRDEIVGSSVPISVLITNRAISAGALISIAADTIAMSYGSHIGAAEPIPLNEKNLAYVSGEFRATAQRTRRDSDIAVAMVDKSYEIEGLVKEGEILDMTASEAYDVGYADYLVDSRVELIEKLGLEDAKVIVKDLDFRYSIAQFLTRYEISSILLTIGLIGIIAEFLTQGFGFAGILGITSFVLYFAGGVIAGNTELWAIFVFLLGIGLLIVELTIPEFGLFGTAGIIAIAVSVIFTAPSLSQGIGTLTIAVILTIIAVPLFIKVFGKTRTMKRIVLSTAETISEGYTHADRRDELLGKTGKTHTTLRPSGSAYIDGEKVDVIANGDFISKDAEIKVIRIEGAKVIVSPIKPN